MHQTFVDLLNENRTHAAEFDSKFDHCQDSQQPEAVTICCSDSRVLQDHIWNNDQPGRLFTAGNIGNRVVQEEDGESVVSGDVLYPIAHTETKTAVVMGHTGCGAVTATYDALTTPEGLNEPPGIGHCLDLLKPHVKPALELLDDDLERGEAINRLVEYNVDRQVDFLLHSNQIPEAVNCVGVVYDFQDAYSGKRGEVHVINANGETNVETLKSDHPEIDSHIERLWEY